MTSPPIRKIVDEVSKKLTDEGKIIEAGFVAYRKFVMSDDAPPIQVDECRFAFFAGAQHLFGTLMSVMEPDHEPTGNDLRRMDQIHAELQKFANEELKQRIEPTKGDS